MKILKQRIDKAFGGASKERGASNLEIVTWISVCLVVATSLFYFRDNIYNFIAGASIQIAGEENDGRNEYGFYFDKIYDSSSGVSFVFKEDGSREVRSTSTGSLYTTNPPGTWTYSDGCATGYGSGCTFSTDGKTGTFNDGVTLKLRE